MIDQDGLVWRSCLKLYQEKFLLKTNKNNQAHIFQIVILCEDEQKKHARNSRLELSFLRNYS